MTSEWKPDLRGNSHEIKEYLEDQGVYDTFDYLLKEPRASCRVVYCMYDPALQAPPSPPQRVWFPPPPRWVGVGPAECLRWALGQASSCGTRGRSALTENTNPHQRCNEKGAPQRDDAAGVECIVLLVSPLAGTQPPHHVKAATRRRGFTALFLRKRVKVLAAATPLVELQHARPADVSVCSQFGKQDQRQLVRSQQPSTTQPLRSRPTHGICSLPGPGSGKEGCPQGTLHSSCIPPQVPVRPSLKDPRPRVRSLGGLSRGVLTVLTYKRGKRRPFLLAAFCALRPFRHPAASSQRLS